MFDRDAVREALEAPSVNAVSVVEKAIQQLLAPEGIHVVHPPGTILFTCPRRGTPIERPTGRSARAHVDRTVLVPADVAPAEPVPAEPMLDGHGVGAELDDHRVALLEEGAEWLGQAEQLQRAAAQVAGAQVRSLAAFARCRPNAWDRQPGEQGAASKASQAARPAALTSVSEWAVAEVAARLRLPERSASTLLVQAVELVEQLPATLAALESGLITWAHALALVDLLGTVSTEKKPLVEERVLRRAAQQTVPQLRECTRRAIAKIDAEAQLRRITKAVRGRKVVHEPGPDGMDTITVYLPGPVARACTAALREYAKASAVAEGGEPDPRCTDERMADTWADLVLRPDAEGRSPIQVVLNIVATVSTLTGTGPHADEPGEIDGQMVPAPLVRELAYTLGLLPRQTSPVDLADPPPATGATDAGADVRSEQDAETGAEVDGLSEEAAEALRARATDLREQAAAIVQANAERDTARRAAAEPTIEAYSGAASRLSRRNADELLDPPDPPHASTEPPADSPGGAADHRDTAERCRQLATAAAEAQARAALAELANLSQLAASALAERPRIALVDELTGTLLALSTATELRAAARDGRAMGPPPETPDYRPSAPLDRFCRLRDRRCRFPGCRARIRVCDLDHRVPYPLGATTHDNLEGLCPFHHRLSHQAPGWTLTASADGGLVWTLPGGITITTVPPRFGTDDGSAPPAEPSAPTGATARSRRLLPRFTEEELATLIAEAGTPRPHSCEDPDDLAPF